VAKRNLAPPFMTSKTIFLMRLRPHRRSVRKQKGVVYLFGISQTCELFANKLLYFSFDFYYLTFFFKIFLICLFNIRDQSAPTITESSNEARECPICFQQWSSTGQHRVCCLKVLLHLHIFYCHYHSHCIFLVRALIRERSSRNVFSCSSIVFIVKIASNGGFLKIKPVQR
jgi:hypothetical protein